MTASFVPAVSDVTCMARSALCLISLYRAFIDWKNLHGSRKAKSPVL